MKQLTIKVIDHKDHRYPTVGDWWVEPNGDIQIRVSDMKDWKKEMLVGIHEAVEALSCISDGIDPDSLDEFDVAFEQNRGDDDLSEPGDDPNAPYYHQHQLATGVERILASAWNVPWPEYEETIWSLE